MVIDNNSGFAGIYAICICICIYISIYKVYKNLTKPNIYTVSKK